MENPRTANELLVVSLGANEVRRYDANTGAYRGVLISAAEHGLKSPDGLARDSDGNYYLSGFHSDNILKFDAAGKFVSVLTDGIRGPTTGIIDRDGYLLIGGFGEEGESRGTDGREDIAERCKGPCACKLVRYDLKTSTFAGVFAQGGGLNGPDGVHYGPDGNLYVSSFRGDQVLRFDGTTGQFIDVFAEHPMLDGASGLLFGSDGLLYVTSWYPGLLLRFDGRTGAFKDVFIEGLVFPNRVARAPDGNLLVSSLGANQVGKYDQATGKLLSVFVDDVPYPTDLMFI